MKKNTIGASIVLLMVCCLFLTGCPQAAEPGTPSTPDNPSNPAAPTTTDGYIMPQDPAGTPTITVTVRYKEVTDLSAEDQAAINAANESDKFSSYIRNGLVPESYRYYKEMTFNLTPSQIKEKIPSNAFKYYKTYNGYPNYQNTIGNVEWNGSSSVSSITVLFNYIHPSQFETEADECRYYFWDSKVNAYTKVWLGPKLRFSDWTHDYYSEVYDAYSDAERTTEFDMSSSNWGNVNKVFLKPNGKIAVNEYQIKSFEEVKADTSKVYYYYDDSGKVTWDRETWVPALSYDVSDDIDSPDYW